MRRTLPTVTHSVPHSATDPAQQPVPHPATRAARAVGTWINGAPGTYLWLTALFVTTVALHRVSPDLEKDFLRRRSAGLDEPSARPVVRVLVSGTLWIDGARWLPYAALYTAFHASAEHWLGTLRWSAVAAASHAGATLISQGVLSRAVHQGHTHEAAARSLDVGVSYALAGVVAVLAYRIAPPWRYPYLGAVLIFYGVPLLAVPTFTDIGHFAAALIGLACYPLTRRRPRRRDQGRRRPDLDRATNGGVRTPS